ncbi:MAG: hypothetical protein J0I12_17965 [Candidatus Eremiobacteraeota bacterium]|nr:hypothetical protein [Candidatus Eremiobacteraeota bacterium]
MNAVDTRPLLLLSCDLPPALVESLQTDYRLLGSAEDGPPDLIVSDRPQPDGLPWLAVLRHSLDHDRRTAFLSQGAADIASADHPQELLWRIRRLLEAHRQRRRLEGELDSLTYSISHDLRAPLRAVGGFSELFLSEYGATLLPEGRHYLERVCSNAQRLSHMVDDLLTLSRLFREPARPKHLDVTLMVQQILDQLRAQEPSRQVVVQVEEGMTLLADRRLLRTVWEQLLDNAWKFTGQQAEARIAVGGGPQRFWVRDNGVGYDPRYAEHLFAPFQRLHREAFPGRGIGLATAARIVSWLGGEIWAESSPGAGATFYFRLPARGA